MIYFSIENSQRQEPRQFIESWTAPADIRLIFLGQLYPEDLSQRKLCISKVIAK